MLLSLVGKAVLSKVFLGKLYLGKLFLSKQQKHCCLAVLLFFMSGNIALASRIKSDEIVVFFNTTAYLEKTEKFWHVPIHVWVNEPEDSYFRAKLFAAVLEAKYDLTLDTNSKPYFSRRTNLLIADNERGKEVKILFAGKEYALRTTKPNGQSVSLLKIPMEQLGPIKDGELMEYQAILSKGDKRKFVGRVKFVYGEGISVISDIDDTVKITEVTNHHALFENTFFKPFAPVPGMPSVYQNWAEHAVSIHFVSSTPWQLYTELAAFAENSGFPWASFNLKAIRFRDETLFDLFKKGTETKPLQIEPILRAYPKRKFILVGDSGEQDPEVYAGIVKKYPKQIVRVYIRSVNNYIKDQKRMRDLFSGLLEESSLDKPSWTLFTHPGELSLPAFTPGM